MKSKKNCQQNRFVSVCVCVMIDFFSSLPGFIKQCRCCRFYGWFKWSINRLIDAIQCATKKIANSEKWNFEIIIIIIIITHINTNTSWLMYMLDRCYKWNFDKKKTFLHQKKWKFFSKHQLMMNSIKKNQSFFFFCTKRNETSSTNDYGQMMMIMVVVIVFVYFQNKKLRPLCFFFVVVVVVAHYIVEHHIVHIYIQKHLNIDYDDILDI